MYLNASILQQIYRSWLVIWFGAFICFMTILSCNIQLYLSPTLTLA